MDKSAETLTSFNPTISFLRSIAVEARQLGNQAILRIVTDETRGHGNEGTRADPQQALLVVYNGDSNGWMFKLSEQRTLLGRDSVADVKLQGQSVSRCHAEIIKSGEQYFLRDLHSTNGTHFRGVLQGAERQLSDGDCFRIGSSDFIFRTRNAVH